jgi:putative membrane protein
MITVIFASIAALIHVYIFGLESLMWGRPKTNRTFGMTPEAAESNRLFAFNQGFYNLFLAIAAISGLVIGINVPMGKTLVMYSLASMVGAALVLIYSNPKLKRPALIQGVPPLLGLIFLFV